MSRLFLRLDTLGNFDYGKAAVAWSEAVKRIVQDMLDRPGDKTKREVVLRMTAQPVLEQSGDVVDAEVEFEISAKVPKWRTAGSKTGLAKGGQMYFQELASDNPRQRTIDEAGAEFVGDPEEEN